MGVAGTHRRKQAGTTATKHFVSSHTKRPCDMHNTREATQRPWRVTHNLADSILAGPRPDVIEEHEEIINGQKVMVKRIAPRPASDTGGIYGL